MPRDSVVGEWVLVENLGEGKRGPAMVHIPVGVFVILFKTLPVCDSYYIASTQSLSLCPLIWGLAGIEMANLPAEKGAEERQDSRWFVLNMYHLTFFVLNISC